MKKIILIGGSPTAGKSYIARRLSEEISFPWISTDTIREMMRKVVSKKDYPALFAHAQATPEMAIDFYGKNSCAEIVKLQNQESYDVWHGVKALIDTDYVWKNFLSGR